MRHLANLGGNTLHVVAQMPFLRLVNPGCPCWDAQSTCDCHGTGPLLIPPCCGCLLLLWLSYLFSLGVAPSPFHPQPIKLQQESSVTSHSSGLFKKNPSQKHLSHCFSSNNLFMKIVEVEHIFSCLACCHTSIFPYLTLWWYLVSIRCSCCWVFIVMQ